MSRLTWRHPDGSWGLNGLDWKELGALPPRVYGAVAKLKDLEELIDQANTEDLRDGRDLRALDELLGMGNGERRNLSWILSLLRE